MEDVSVVGLDLAKRVFQVHGAALDGRVVCRKKLSRGQLHDFFAQGHSRTQCMRWPCPIDFALARLRDGIKWRSVGISSRTTRRGPYAASTFWAQAHGIMTSMSRARWPVASFVNRSRRYA